MKARYLSLVIATVLSSNVVAAPIQELATSEVKAKSESTTTVTTQELENIQVNDLKGTLSKFVGVSVSNSSRYSQKTYLRGVEEHSANVTLDGARQDGQMFHHSGNQKHRYLYRGGGVRRPGPPLFLKNFQDFDDFQDSQDSMF